MGALGDMASTGRAVAADSVFRCILRNLLKLGPVPVAIDNVQDWTGWLPGDSGPRVNGPSHQAPHRQGCRRVGNYLMAALFSRPLLVIDTETTGLPRHKHAQVIEIGAVLLSCSGHEIASCGALVRCPLPLPPEADYAMKVNQINPAHIAEAGDAMMSSRLLWAIVKEIDPMVTAYNVGFDRPMLVKSGIRFGAAERWGPCIMLTAKRAMGVSKWPKLSAAAEHYGVTVEGQAHRAITDARTAAGVAIAIARAGDWP